MSDEMIIFDSTHVLCTTTRVYRISVEHWITWRPVRDMYSFDAQRRVRDKCQFTMSAYGTSSQENKQQTSINAGNA